MPKTNQPANEVNEFQPIRGRPRRVMTSPSQENKCAYCLELSICYLFVCLPESALAATVKCSFVYLNSSWYGLNCKSLKYFIYSLFNVFLCMNKHKKRKTTFCMNLCKCIIYILVSMYFSIFILDTQYSQWIMFWCQTGLLENDNTLGKSTWQRIRCLDHILFRLPLGKYLTCQQYHFLLLLFTHVSALYPLSQFICFLL